MRKDVVYHRNRSKSASAGGNATARTQAIVTSEESESCDGGTALAPFIKTRRRNRKQSDPMKVTGKAQPELVW